MRRPFVLAVLLVAHLLSPLPAPAAAAQAPAPRVSIQGIVLDPSHAPIAGARVTATGDGQRSQVSAPTDQAGRFTMLLEPGEYVLRASANGFTDLTQRVDTLNWDLAALEFVLQVAGVRETVTISAPTGYQVPAISSATKTPTPLLDVPQSVTIVTQDLIRDQLMTSMGDVVRYVPGISAHQGENNRDDVVIRGNRSSADFYVNGVRDDVQYYRDLYNLERVEALKGPNALIFGRGGGGGVVNRVVKEAVFRPLQSFAVQGGGYGHKRATADLERPLSPKVSFRLNGMFESSDSFRRGVDLERTGVNPTLTIRPGDRTKVAVGYEYLRDTRVADRGITSANGRPADVDRATFYGNPDESAVRARVHLTSVAVDHRIGGVTLRNRTLAGAYDRFYQNFVPGASSADRTLVALTSYNNATERTNVFNQTDLTFAASTGRVRHTLLAGAEFGRQLTDNFRSSGFFNGTATSLQVPFDNPTIRTPVTFRQNATDADNHVRTNVAAAFVQDQAELSKYLQLIGGVRFDRFDLQHHNNRNGETLERVDNLVSPRAGVVFKPIADVSIYGSYSVSFLPSAGDQFSSLTTITQQVKPEQFTNYEVGAKWDTGRGLSVTTALYRVNRTNTRATDPFDPARIVQTGSQRTNGYELGLNGQVTPAWQIAGGYAYQDAFVTSATTAARAGATVGQVPKHTFSLWNHYKIHPRLAGAVGVLRRSEMFAAIDNTVTLPGYTRADVAAFFSVNKDWRLQVNVENVFDRKYFVNADSNTNISPGYPRVLRAALVAVF